MTFKISYEQDLNPIEWIAASASRNIYEYVRAHFRDNDSWHYEVSKSTTFGEMRVDVRYTVNVTERKHK